METLKKVAAIILVSGAIVGTKVAYDEAEYTEKVDAVATETGLPTEKSESGRLTPVLTDVRLRKLKDDSVVAVATVNLPDGGEAAVVYRESPCVIPDCGLPDGGWDDKSPGVDCRTTLTLDGGPRWAGCNVMPRSASVGAQCLPAACGSDGEAVGVVR
jgi:hypothetical protein